VPKRPLPIAVSTIEQVERLHMAVDRMVAPLTARHAGRLQCREGCTGCCVDDLSVFAVEAATIVRHHAALLTSEAPHPVGACAMLDDAGRCRIYAHRPYVCRTQGLPLRWLDADESVEGDAPRELRDICELNDHAEPIVSLPPDACWTLGPVEARLSDLQAQATPDQRIALRDLFT
jgi:hypothetical protein